MNEDFRFLEGIFFGLIGLFFLISVIPSPIQSLGGLIFVLVFLGVYYLVVGTWYFKTKKTSRFLAISTGLSLSLCLFVLGNVLEPIDAPKLIIFLLPLLAILIFTRVKLRKLIEDKMSKTLYQFIFKRGIILFCVTTIFTLGSVHFTPFRYVLIALNAGDYTMSSNLNMFHYKSFYDDAIDDEDCERAIKYANLTNQSGLNWLGYDTIEDFKIAQEKRRKSIENTIDLTGLTEYPVGFFSDLYKIEGTFEAQLKAYECKAYRLYESQQYEEALEAYSKMNEVIESYNGQSAMWKSSKNYTFQKLADCHAKLDNFILSDSLYLLSLNGYLENKDNLDERIFDLMYNISKALSDRSFYTQSNETLIKSLRLLDSQLISMDSKAINTYKTNVLIMLMSNYIMIDNLDEAYSFVENMRLDLDKSSNLYCQTILYEALIEYKKSNFQGTDDLLEICQSCYSKINHESLTNSIQLIIYLTKANTQLVLAKYGKTKEYIDEGIGIIEESDKFKSKQNLVYANYLFTESKRELALGVYDKANTLFEEYLNLQKQLSGENSLKVAEAYTHLAQLNYSISKSNKAQKYADLADQIIKTNQENTYSSNSDMLFALAEVQTDLGNYASADTLFQFISDFNEGSYLENTIFQANVLRGLGTLRLKEGKYKEATSFLSQALKIYDRIFYTNHPYIADVHLQQAKVYIELKDWSKADKQINKAIKVNKALYTNNHMDLADCYHVKGDLYRAQSQNKKATEAYTLSKTMINAIFGEDHSKSKELDLKLAKL